MKQYNDDNTGYQAIGNARIGSDSLIFSGKGYVSLGQSPELFGLDAFTISFDLTVSNEKGDNKGSVRLVWNQDHYGIEMAGDDLIFRIYTDTGVVQTVRAEDVGIRDGGEHNIVMSYDSETGIMSGYVDGIQVAEATGLTGSISMSTGRDVTIGGAVRGRQLTGEIDNFTMWNDADHGPDAVYADASLSIVEASMSSTEAGSADSTDSSPSTESTPDTLADPYDPEDELSDGASDTSDHAETYSAAWTGKKDLIYITEKILVVGPVVQEVLIQWIADLERRNDPNPPEGLPDDILERLIELRNFLTQLIEESKEGKALSLEKLKEFISKSDNSLGIIKDRAVSLCSGVGVSSLTIAAGVGAKQLIDSLLNQVTTTDTSTIVATGMAIGAKAAAETYKKRRKGKEEK